MKIRGSAFKYALRGACTLVATQPHAKFHLGCTLVVLLLGNFLRLAALEWALLIFAIAIVWLAEAVNTAIEFLADEVSLDWRQRIMHAKDIAAFGVLAAAIGATAIGFFIFLPRLLNYL